MPVATPCVGLCSTAFGDVVCRGCKRYVHEIVGWNGFTEGQQRLVIDRLDRLRSEALGTHAVVCDVQQLAKIAGPLRIAATLTPEVRAFEVLRRTAQRWVSLRDIGCRALDGDDDPVAAKSAIEAEFLRRSRARYEHDFRVLLDG